MNINYFFLIALFSLFTLGQDHSQHQHQSNPDQNKYKFVIKGKVVDEETLQPLEYATISLVNKKKPKMIQGGITDSEGIFSFDVFQGTYDITIEFISFDSYEQKDVLIGSDLDLGIIQLSIRSNTLGEVAVVGEKIEVEIRLDKRVYNVGKDITVRGGSVSDVLDNVPSVSVDVEGNVSLRGNENVRILINGRPSALVGLNGSQGLRQLPAESIEKVEVITSPSARYDAEGSAGILNIILKKEKLEGINGSIIANGGLPINYGGTLQLNWRTKKINIFNTTTYNNAKVPGNSLKIIDYSDKSSLNETRVFDRNRVQFFTNFGIEYFITNNSSITIGAFLRDAGSNDLTTNKTISKSISGGIADIERIEDEEETTGGFQYSVNYIKNFNNKGHKLTFDAQIEGHDDRQTSDIENTTFLVPQNEIKNEEVIETEDHDRVLVQADYVNPFDEKTQLELGYRDTFTSHIADFEVKTESGGVLVKDPLVSNNVKYIENVNAAYAQFGKKINKFSYLLGLRMENTDIGINDSISKKYTDWFPTVNLSYEFNEGKSVVLGYNRRLRRPRTRFLNPFGSRSSLTNIFQGNPDLDPSYSNNWDLGYLKRWDKITLNTSVYFQKTTQVFQFISENSGDMVDIGGGRLVPIIIRYPINIAKNDRWGTEFTLSYNPSKKIRLNGNFNFFQSKTTGRHKELDLGATNLSWFFRLNSAIKLPWDIDWQLRFFYRGPRQTAIEDVQGIFFLSGALNKSILKDRGTISFRVSDIFNSRKRKGTTTTSMFTEYIEFQWREPSYIFSFTYRLNNKKNQRRRRQQGHDHHGGGEENFEGG